MTNLTDLNSTELLFINSITTNSTESIASGFLVPAHAGFLCIIGASVFWASVYVPVKHYDIGDGIYYQFIIFVSLWLAGFIVNWFRKFPPFYALPLLGGLLNTSANLTGSFAVKLIGIGLATTLWNMISLIVGWSTARFGLLGLEASAPSNSTLNSLGVSFAVVSLVIYGFVKSEVSPTNKVEDRSLPIPMTPLNKSATIEQRIASSKLCCEENLIISKLLKASRRIFGMFLVICTGLFFGLAHNIVLIQSQITKNSNFFDYWFSFYTGSLVSSFVVFMFYCAFKKNKPIISPELTLPATVAGWVWAVGDAFYFISTGSLSATISFPLTSCGPPVVSLLYGIFVYKEIRGVQNLIIVLVGFCVAITASVLIGLSF